MRSGVLVPALALAVLRPSVASSQEPLVTDRPDFTESAAAVPAGRFQLEGGATWSAVEDDHELALGEALLRIGLVPAWELRLEAPSWVDAPGASGLADPFIGLKAELPRAAGADLALVAGTTLPLGDADVGGDELVPEAALAAAWEITPPWSLGANLGLAVPDPDGRRLEGWASAAFGVGLGDRLGAFFEAYGFVNQEDSAGPAFADTGLTFLVHEDFQLDVRAGAGLFQAAGDWFVGVGVARRW